MLLSRVIRKFSCSLSQSLSKSLQFNRARALISKPATFRTKMSLKSEFILELNTPFELLEVSESFENLTEQEKKYLHYYTKVRLSFLLEFLK